MSIVLEILRNVFGMAWKIAWGLALGFAISGFIQVFAPRQRVAEELGEAGPRQLALATGLGMASSSCSYAAAAMSKSLFRKGAHIVNATAFLFASTNLVLEIGLIIWSLLGGYFVVAELAGGIVLILVVSVLLRWLAPRSVFKAAREHLEHAEGHDHDHGGETLPLGRLFTGAGIAAAGGYFVEDWRMVGKDVVLGVVIAGILAAVVPNEWWQALFLGGGGEGEPGLWVSLENVLVGPLIAILSFVCSVGNIPLAAVLWSNGISFAGVVAFIFADLVTIPMILVYRRYYGWRPALIYAGYLLVTMIVAALIVELGFRFLGAVPEHGGASAATRDYFAWDYTTVLNLIFLPLGAALAWLGTRGRS